MSGKGKSLAIHGQPAQYPSGGDRQTRLRPFFALFGMIIPNFSGESLKLFLGSCHLKGRSPKSL
jgi:hypothetical protein